MQQYRSASTFSFSVILASVLALSGIFFSYAYAEEVAVPETQTVVIESPVVSTALSFIAEHGTTESHGSEDSSKNERPDSKDTQTKEDEGSGSDESSKGEHERKEKNMTYVPHDPTCPVSEGQTPRPVTLVITKIVCAQESDLPNWGNGGPDITANTASEFLASHPSCHTVSHWGFQWGDQTVTNPGDDFLWDVAGTSRWSILGFTNEHGVLTKELSIGSDVSEIRVREMLEPGYLPFSYGANASTNVDPVSAELYCANDVLNYDNFDFVRNPVGGQTYHCVAWNVRKSAVNNPPVITLLGSNPQTLTVGETFVDAGATASDPEDGALTPVVTGSVNASAVGTYTIRYTATDSAGLSVFVERTVNVVPAGQKPVCADGIDNDNDGSIDFPADLGCMSATDTDENDTPIITVIGQNPATIVIGTIFTDLGATSTDKEDGILIPVATGTVNVMATGTYTIIYTATDSKGLSATATRVVNVVPAGSTTQCSDGIDNDADGTIDFPADAGCSSATDNDENNAPVITLIGGNVSIVIGTTYTDLGATATDTEDGNITANITATGTVNTATLGTYTISYNVKDSKGLAATEVIRTVSVIPATTGGGGNPGGSVPPKCSNGQDDDNDGKADYPNDSGCTSSQDDDETDVPVVTGGGGGAPGNGLGGGTGTPGLQIFNEKLSFVTPTSVKITWNTNLLADSRVVYGEFSKTTLGTAPQYGYPNTTSTSTVATSSHEMVVTGIKEGSVAFFRPISSNGASTVVGIELVTPVVQGSCTYLEKYLRLGYENDPIEVTKLQRFLKEYEGFTNLQVTGTFDLATDQAVRAFQDKYGAEVLAPWGLPANTGYVYYTTKKKINEIYCQRAFPLDADQLKEIVEYVAATTKSSDISIEPTLPTITVTKSPSTGNTQSGSVIDLSNIDLSDMAPKTPVTVLVPGETTGEIASGVSTDIAEVEKRDGNVLSIKSLLASLRMNMNNAKTPAGLASTSAKGTTTAQSDTAPCDASGTSTAMGIGSIIASIAATIGISTGALWVWFILFLIVLLLGYLMARKNRQYRS